ncbi:MAG: hypothetical protein RI911_772 [Candidatus Parcubacteria bacterium]|jgi:3-methyladenine DNA glycosylase AlkC
MTETFSLKDHLFNAGKVEKIAGEIARVYPAFQKAAFIQEVISEFPRLELKARITWIAACLHKHLPVDYSRAVSILVKSLPKPNNPDLLDDDFGDFIYAPYAEFVAKYGCTSEQLSASLGALYEMTQRFSAEDAIRYFINAFPKQTLAMLKTWAADSHYHVRRLCSEGARPKLPWSQKISLKVHETIPILDMLFSDKTRFVTRSVANHVNDISKTDSVLAIKTLQRWKQTKKQSSAEMDYIIRHALRTLIKAGDPDALALLGFTHGAPVSVSKFQIPKEVRMNSHLVFSCVLVAQTDTNVLVDYAIHFQNKAGKMESKKVFKLTKAALKAGEPLTIQKRHMLRERMTTRTLYRGKHMLVLQINGTNSAQKHFVLV